MRNRSTVRNAPTAAKWRTCSFPSATWTASRATCASGPSASSPTTRRPSEEDGLILRRTEETGCVFLSGNECTVYDARPDICQRFPHLVRGQGSLASRMWQFVDRACYCPIVYNSLEAFKDELGFKRSGGKP